eukprot:524226-Pleurochrysis_carterae.AAC.2
MLPPSGPPRSNISVCIDFLVWRESLSKHDRAACLEEGERLFFSEMRACVRAKTRGSVCACLEGACARPIERVRTRACATNARAPRRRGDSR